MKEWVLTQAAFDELLALLDSDTERAGEKYEHLRGAMIKYFESHACSSPRDLADETINRIARRISEGEEIQSSTLSNYFYGVAKNVLKEQYRARGKEPFAIESLPPSQLPSEDPAELDERRENRLNVERKLECLKRCLNELPPETRQLMMSYYEGEEAAKIENRKQIARNLGISLTNLRIRIHRVREKLEKCMKDCLNRTLLK